MKIRPTETVEEAGCTLQRRLLAALVVITFITVLCFPESSKQTANVQAVAERETRSSAYDKGFWAGVQAAMNEVARAKVAAGDTNILELEMRHVVDAWATNAPSARSTNAEAGR